ncbi:ABC transporter substrate-binding protein [Cohnella hongkongensis]|uniref:ABC transporter substrate-binding protein n=1 Tax=Cohnella hongkongensis TaxID=178337 RepID=A0ABV9FF81_9BACL
MRFAGWKSYFTGMTVIVLLLLVAACGNGADPANSASGGASPGLAEQTPESGGEAAPSAPEAEAGLRTFTAANGTVEVPERPERIVALAPNYAGYLLALGVTPVGVPNFTLGNPYLTDKLKQAVDLGENAPTEPSIEQVLELKPDLIVAIHVLKNLELLEKVAPIVTFESTMNNRELLLALGTLTRREDEAKAWLQGWDEQIAALKPEIEAAVQGRTVSVMYPSAKGIYLFRQGYGRGTEILYGDFGLSMPEKAAQSFEEGKGFFLASLESLPELAGDIIFSAPWLGDSAGADTVYDSPIWKNLPAVKSGYAYQVDYDIFTFSDPFSWQGQLDIIADKLLNR